MIIAVVSDSAVDQTQGSVHTRQQLYHWTVLQSLYIGTVHIYGAQCEFEYSFKKDKDAIVRVFSVPPLFCFLSPPPQL